MIPNPLILQRADPHLSQQADGLYSFTATVPEYDRIELRRAPTIAAPPVRISQPEYPWEKVRFAVNEGPAVIVRHGRVWVTYSAAGTGAEYCLGLLSASADADLLEPKSWRKSPVPVFATSEAHRIYGPGHNSFTTAPDGTDLLVYHARSYRDIPGDPLADPNRHTRVQPFTWRADGSPDFGAPRPDDP